MNREEFRKLIIPLTEKEIRYRDHLTSSDDFFDAMSKSNGRSEDEPLVFPFIELSKENAAGQQLLHGKMLPGETAIPYGSQIAISKQTRFSTVPIHRHAYIELAYMYSGTCTTVVNGETVTLKEGDTVIFNSGVVHTVLPTGENDLLINIMMPQSYFQKNFIEHLSDAGTVSAYLANVMSESQSEEQYLIFHTKANLRVKHFMENLFCEYLDPIMGTPFALDSYMSLIFIELIRCYQSEREKEFHKDSSKGYITEVLQYIEENAVTCTLEETAARFGYHPNYLTRAIRKATGKSFKQLATEIRLSKAAFLLLNTNDPVSQIAETCGYTNQNYFYKKFEEQFSTTPAGYREKMR